MRRACKEITSMRTITTFLKGRACPDTLLNVLNGAFGCPMNGEERAASALAGGIMQHGYQCGMLWGAALAAGAQAHRIFGTGARAEARALDAARRLTQAFQGLHDTINCFDITHIDKSSSNLDMVLYFLVKGGSFGCLRMAAKFAPLAHSEINAAYSDPTFNTACSPLSCSAMVAKKMGASDMHTMMAAGLAGGIGLSGGGCGALGAAIWINGMQEIKTGDGKVGYNSPGSLKIIEKFMAGTGYEFECATIAGRRFETVDAHSEYLRGGGCADLIDILATG